MKKIFLSFIFSLFLPLVCSAGKFDVSLDLCNVPPDLKLDHTKPHIKPFKIHDGFIEKHKKFSINFTVKNGELFTKKEQKKMSESLHPDPSASSFQKQIDTLKKKPDLDLDVGYELSFRCHKQKDGNFVVYMNISYRMLNGLIEADNREIFPDYQSWQINTTTTIYPNQPYPIGIIGRKEILLITIK